MTVPWMHGYDPGAMASWVLGSALVWLVVVVAVVGLVAALATPRTADEDGARRILDERFARGEIGPDEYRARRALIGP